MTPGPEWMMTPSQRVLVTVVGLGLFGLVVELVRRRRLREEYSLIWVLTSIGLLTLPWMYGFYVGLGRLAGIIEATSLFFFFAILGLLLFSLQFSLALSSVLHSRKRMCQEIALMEERIRSLEKALADQQSNGVDGSVKRGPETSCTGGGSKPPKESPADTYIEDQL